MLRRNFTLTNSSEEIIRGELRHREDIKSAPAVIICHGFKGFKDWGFFPVVAETLCAAGYAAITFNFSRNGVGSDPQNFTDLDQFSKNTYSHEIADLECVVDAILTGGLGKGLIDPEKIGLMGHSRGGGIAILYASNNSSVSALVTWSAISTVERYSEEQIKEWKNNGFIEIENKRTNQMMRIDSDFITDIEKNRKKLDILAAASRLEMPCLIIHGGEDESVPVEEAHKIFNSLEAESKDLMIIEKGSHTFGTAHPMVTRSETFDTALDLTENWFDRYLVD